MSGLRGANINVSFSLDQIEDAIVQERMIIIKEYSIKNMIPAKDLLVSIPCIQVDCKDIDRCCCVEYGADKIKHIEIPQVYNDFGSEAIQYIGSVDRMKPYTVYTTDAFRQHKFRRRGANDPFVWVDTTPNSNNMNDAFIFNASSLLQDILAVIIPKDLRQLANYSCCPISEVSNISFIDTEIEKRVTEKYIRWYRQTAMPITPNDQTIKA